MKADSRDTVIRHADAGSRGRPATASRRVTSSHIFVLGISARSLISKRDCFHAATPSLKDRPTITFRKDSKLQIMNFFHKPIVQKITSRNKSVASSIGSQPLKLTAAYCSICIEITNSNKKPTVTSVSKPPKHNAVYSCIIRRVLLHKNKTDALIMDSTCSDMGWNTLAVNQESSRPDELRDHALEIGFSGKRYENIQKT